MAIPAPAPEEAAGEAMVEMAEADENSVNRFFSHETRGHRQGERFKKCAGDSS